MTRRGRPKAFDRETALRTAMSLFWTQGYEGTTIGDLTERMGINRPSLYGTFGSKEALFREAIALYDDVECEAIRRALGEEPTARDAIGAVLRHNARTYVSADKPRGCMIVLSALTGTPRNEMVRRFLTRARMAGEDALRERIERGRRDGDVPASVDAQKVASFYNTVMQGLSIQARDGASSAQLRELADCAMAAWDTIAGAAGRKARNARRPKAERSPRAGRSVPRRAGARERRGNG